jgi:hypothetical protein
MYSLDLWQAKSGAQFMFTQENPASKAIGSCELVFLRVVTEFESLSPSEDGA